jgi:hypothetical protein
MLDLGKKVRPSLKSNLKKKGLAMWPEHMPSKHKALEFKSQYCQKIMLKTSTLTEYAALLIDIKTKENTLKLSVDLEKNFQCFHKMRNYYVSQHFYFYKDLSYRK